MEALQQLSEMDLQELKKINKYRRTTDRIKTLMCLGAAHCLDMAKLYSHPDVLKPTSLEKAEQEAKFFNLFPIWGVDYDYSAIEILSLNPGQQESINESLEYFRSYKNWLENADAIGVTRRTLEAFATWYAENRWETVRIKVVMFWIENFGIMLLKKSSGLITEDEFDDFVEWAKTTTGYFMGYRPRDVAKAFVKAQNKLEEISSKVAYREELK